MRKTKVRIVGDPELAGKVAQVIKDHFKLNGYQRFSTMPTRYGTGHSDSPGCSIYLDIKKPKEPLKMPFKFETSGVEQRPK